MINHTLLQGDKLMASISNVGSTNEDKMKLVSRDDKKKAIDLAMQVSLSLKAAKKQNQNQAGHPLESFPKTRH